MRTLLMDTSADHVSVALFVDGIGVYEEYRKAERRYNSMIIEMIESACRAAAITPKDIQEYGSVMGPGTFTGVRVGIAVAKAMCRATGARFLGASTLAVIAASAGKAGKVMSMLDARRGEVYCAEYDLSDGLVRTIREPYATGKDDFMTHAANYDGTVCMIKRDEAFAVGLPSAVISERIELKAFYSLAVKGAAEADLYASAPVYVRKPDAEIKKA